MEWPHSRPLSHSPGVRITEKLRLLVYDLAGTASLSFVDHLVFILATVLFVFATVLFILTTVLYMLATVLLCWPLFSCVGRCSLYVGHCSVFRQCSLYIGHLFLCRPLFLLDWPLFSLCWPLLALCWPCSFTAYFGQLYYHIYRLPLRFISAGDTLVFTLANAALIHMLASAFLLLFLGQCCYWLCFPVLYYCLYLFSSFLTVLVCYNVLRL